MQSVTPADVIMAACGVLGFVIALGTWLVKRGGTEREMTIAVRDNTSATRELSAVVHGLVDKIHMLDLRVTRLEAPQNYVMTRLEAPSQNVSSPPDRNASP